MSNVKCPDCGHRFYVATSDQERRYDEDVAWDKAARALKNVVRRSVTVTMTATRVTKDVTVVRRYGTNAIGGPPTIPPRGVR